MTTASPRLAGHEAEIVRLYVEEGLSQRAIAARLGYSPESARLVGEMLRDSGIEILDRSGRWRWARKKIKPRGKSKSVLVETDRVVKLRHRLYGSKRYEDMRLVR